MTGHHPHAPHQNAFVNSRAGTPRPLKLARRDFLRLGMVSLSGAALTTLLLDPGHTGFAQEFKGKRLYLAPDDHTDLFWTADLETYDAAFVGMLDYYLDLVDKTAGEPAEFQSRWNCDGSYWVWVYERDKPSADFERLIDRIRDEHIGIPLNALCICPGGAPAEAVLRGMYYPGRLERRFGLRFNLAYSMENQTLPLGLGALWAGAGATFSWKGICGCATRIPDAGDREHDIYWWAGLDGSRLLMKWNSMLLGNQRLGGYAEAREPEELVFLVESEEFKARYPYQVIGAFGYGWDDLENRTDRFSEAARKMTSENLKVIISNEMDFARDFEAEYGEAIPSLTASFGNEWDLDCASMAEVSARVKRAVEKLHTAEGLAALVSLQQTDFMQGRETARDQAWMNLGLFWEHNGQGAPWDGLTEKKIVWNRRVTDEIVAYVDTLQADALASLGRMIPNPSANERFFVFNPLSWKRTDYADLVYHGSGPVHVVDVENEEEAPSQFITVNEKQWLRIQAADVLSVGYKVYEVRPGAGETFPNAAEVRAGEIENELVRVGLDGRGAIIDLEDKIRNRQLAEVLNDLGPGAGVLRIENEGPVSVTLAAASEYPLAHTSRVTMFRDSDRVEIHNEITQVFDATQTWSFGFAVPNPHIHHEEVGAILYARLTGEGGHYSPRNARYDWLTLNHFADIHQDSGFGVTLSNADCYFMKTGASTVETLDTRTPRITVLAGGRDLNESGALASQGGDEHFTQRFALRPHDGYDPVSAMRFALEHQNPLCAGRVSGGSGYPETSFSLLELDNPDVLLWALKPAEDGLQDGLIVRIWNLSNNAASFSLKMSSGGITAGLQLTHIETPVGNATIQDGALADAVNPQQIKTYSIFPAQLPFLPPPAKFPTASAQTAISTPAASSTGSPALPAPGTEEIPAQGSKGCLMGLWEALVHSLMK